MKRDFRLHDGQRGSALAILVIPRAEKNEVAGIGTDGTVSIRLQTPADDAAINRSLVSFLAEILKIPSGKIEVVAGQSSRSKLVSILDLSAQVAQERILRHSG